MKLPAPHFGLFTLDRVTAPVSHDIVTVLQPDYGILNKDVVKLTCILPSERSYS